MSGEFAGALGQRVLVRGRSAGRDDLGGAVDGWGEGVAVWAMVSPLAARAAEGDRPTGRARWRVVLRAGIEVAPGDRLGWRGAEFAVRSVEVDPAAPDRIGLVVEEGR